MSHKGFLGLSPLAALRLSSLCVKSLDVCAGSVGTVTEPCLCVTESLAVGTCGCSSSPCGFLKSSSCKRKGPHVPGEQGEGQEPWAITPALAVTSSLWELNPSAFRSTAGRDVLMAGPFQLSVQLCHSQGTEGQWWQQDCSMS